MKKVVFRNFQIRRIGKPIHEGGVSETRTGETLHQVAFERRDERAGNNAVRLHRDLQRSFDEALREAGV